MTLILAPRSTLLSENVHVSGYAVKSLEFVVADNFMEHYIFFGSPPPQIYILDKNTF